MEVSVYAERKEDFMGKGEMAWKPDDSRGFCSLYVENYIKYWKNKYKYEETCEKNPYTQQKNNEEGSEKRRIKEKITKIDIIYTWFIWINMIKWRT